tara:strand:+ start:5997 stop:6218 length:222 start_codon:yes stop_codon:yes gene_type:complete
VSVKTITTSNHVSLNEKTLYQVDRIIVVWLGTEADELDVVIVYDKSVDEFVARSSPLAMENVIDDGSRHKAEA